MIKASTSVASDPNPPIQGMGPWNPVRGLFNLACELELGIPELADF